MDPAGGPGADRTEQRLDRELREARVTASSPRGVVKVVYNGHGDGVGMELRSGAVRQYGSESMAGFMTAALQAADRAVKALHEHLRQRARAATEHADAAATVSRCFGGGGA